MTETEMTQEEFHKELKRICTAIDTLLEDYQPGLTTWWLFLDRFLKEMHELTTYYINH